MNQNEYKKFITPQSEYVGSKTALIKAIRKRKPYTDLQSKTKQQLFRIFQKVK